MDKRHRSSEPKEPEKPQDDYDKENLDFHAFSPQPIRDSFLPRIQRMRDRDKKTLILDLDETLVHSSFEKCKADIELPVTMDGQDHIIYVKIRPRARDFLKKITKYYEVAIFTASVANYADPLIDLLDGNKYGFYKLFREHCTYNGNYVKDLSRLGRDLKDCIIVDNLPKSYANQPDNGLPIVSWYDDENDKELELLFPILIMLSEVKDVRSYIKKIVVKDRINYDIVFSLFQKNPVYHQTLKTMWKIKNQIMTPSPKKSKKKMLKDSKVNKENKSKVANSQKYNSHNFK